MLDNHWHKQVLHFWFDELTPKQWYISTPALDESIRVQFEPLMEQLAQTPADSLASFPQHLLAAIIVLDQFPRNCYRGSSRAFAYDEFAQAMSQHAVSHGFDEAFNESEKQFCYMPLMHAENLAKQDQCVSLFIKLGNDIGVQHAQEHRDIIKQFGRFPHRNEVLGRESTPEELHYLKSAKRFGQ